MLMQKAGGIIALNAGIFGFIAAIITLLAGGLVAGIESISDSSNSASTEIGTFGMLGIVFSFLTIVFGAIAMGAKSKISGYVLIVCSVVGAIAGGTLVAICMALALAGGIVAIIGIDGDKKGSGESSET